MHRQHHIAPRHRLGIRRVRAQAEVVELVNHPAAPLDDRTDALGGEVLAQGLAVVYLDLVVLEDVKTVAVLFRRIAA